MVKRHAIDSSDPPITDDMSADADGCSPAVLVGKTCVTAYEIPGSDQAATLLLMDDGTCYEIGCLPADGGYVAHCASDPWEVVLYDVTPTDAGEAMLLLEPGHWALKQTSGGRLGT